MKRKKSPLLVLTAFILLLSSCQKKEVCKSFAPEDKEVSWTDYNTTEAIWDYFGCYAETARQHYGDTLKVVGYVAPPPQGITGPFVYDSANLMKYGLALCDVYDVPINKQHVLFLDFGPYCGLPSGEYVSCSDTIVSKFRDYQYGQLVFATVVIVGRSIDDANCCDQLVSMPIKLRIERKEDKR